MWPFRKSKKSPPPEDVSRGGITARYDTQLEHWIFECEGIEFNLSGIPFNEAAFDWAREAVALLHALDGEIRNRVMSCLEGWPCDKSKAHILSVDLDGYAESKTIDVAFIGDESWGDLGIDVVITNGSIVDVYGGD